MCQQKAENTIPTYSQGTFMPEMSPLMWHNSDCSSTGITFRFQPLRAYSCGMEVVSHPDVMEALLK